MLRRAPAAVAASLPAMYTSAAPAASGERSVRESAPSVLQMVRVRVRVRVRVNLTPTLTLTLTLTRHSSGRSGGR